jgi:uncharacterized protein YraI
MSFAIRTNESRRTIMKTPTCLLAAAAALLLTTGIAGAATVAANADLNVRSGPGTQYPIIGVIPDGGSAFSSGCRYGWCHVDYRGLRGWSSSAFLTGSAVAVAPPAVSVAPPAVSVAPPAVAIAPPYYAQPYYSSPGIGIGLGPFGFLGL